MEIYRYLPTQFVDLFFRTGEIQLSTIRQCRRIEGKHADPHDAKGTLLIHSADQSLAVRSVAGAKTHVLCCSRRWSLKLRHRFGADDCIVILEPTLFLQAVSRALPEVQLARLGECIYSDSIESSVPGPMLDLPPLTDSSDAETMENRFLEIQRQLSQVVHEQIAGRDIFLKRLSFMVESEVRLAWTMPNEVDGVRTVECREATQYCDRLRRFFSFSRADQ